MKRRLTAILMTLTLTAAVMPRSERTASADPLDYMFTDFPYEVLTADYYAGEVDRNLWERFLKYDLCITDYDELSSETQALCRFIFETERAAKGTVRCERARAILRGEDVGARFTAEQAHDLIRPYDRGEYSTDYQLEPSLYALCVPDIRHLDETAAAEEFWLDDAGTERVLHTGSNSQFSYEFMIYAKTGAEEQAWYAENRGRLENWQWYENLDDNGTYMYFTPQGDVWRCECLALPAQREHEQIEQDHIRYIVNADGTATVVGHTFGQDGIDIETLTIPAEAEGHPVTSVMYLQRAGMSQVILPNTVTHIGRAAFLACSELETVKLPESLVYIGDFAFAMCEKLNTVEFPHGLTYLGGSAFDGCAELQTLRLDCPQLEIAVAAFRNIGLTEAELNVRAIRERAFLSCKQLERVTFGDALETLGANAFEGCEALASAEFSAAPKAIGQGAFAGTAVTSLTVPADTEILGMLAERYGIALRSGLPDIPANDPLTEPDTAIVNPDCEISGYYNTEAHRYAREWGLPFRALDEIAYGDLNGDGEIGAADAVLLASYLHGQAEGIGFAADVNRDGIIHAGDLAALKQLLLSAD